jgi:hypothetical protein
MLAIWLPLCYPAESLLSWSRLSLDGNKAKRRILEHQDSKKFFSLILRPEGRRNAEGDISSERRRERSDRRSSLRNNSLLSFFILCWSYFEHPRQHFEQLSITF